MTKRKNRLLIIFPLLFLLLVLAVMPMSGAAKAAGDSVEISTGMVTNYYMHVPMNGFKADLSEKLSFYQKVPGFANYKRKTLYATVLITFENVTNTDTDSGANVFVSFTTKINFPARINPFDFEVKFTEDFEVNIRKTYYIGLQHFDFSVFRMSILMNGYSIPLQISYWNKKQVFQREGIELYEGPQTPEDPTEDGGIWGDGDGVDGGTANTSPTWWYKFYKIVTKLLHWNISYFWFNIIAVSILAVIVWFVCRLIFGKK